MSEARRGRPRRIRAARAEPPQGRDAVMRALIDAGADLFAEQGPALASVRDIAERAGVNHGLVHRHFGSKEGLLLAVLDDLARRIEAESRRPEGGQRRQAPALRAKPAGPAQDLEDLLERTFVAVTRHPAYFRVLSRALLEGRAVEGLQTEFPVVGRLVAAAARARDEGLLPEKVDARMVVAATVALGLGWLMFEPYLLAATGQSKLDPQVARQKLVRTLLSMRRSPA